MKQDYRGKSLPNKVKGILFDYDGTLVDFIPKWWKPIERAFEAIHGSVPEEKLLADMSDIFANLPKDQSRFFLLKVMYTFGRVGGLGRIQTIRFIKKSKTEFEKSKYLNIPFEGIDNMIDTLKVKGIKLGIVSSASRAELDNAIKEMPYLKDLPTISRDDVSELKPHPEPILKGLELIGTKPSNTIYIGDFHTDVLAGKAANTMTCAVLGEYPEISQKGLEKENPDVIVSATTEILNLITD